VSFDLVAFDPRATTDADFARWYAVRTDWDDDRIYDDISIATPQLQAFYADLIDIYPPMNGPGSPTSGELEADPDLEEWLTDYSIDSQLIYAAFGWSKRAPASAMFAGLAASHGVAVAYVSEDPVRLVRPREKRRGRLFRRG
jgi:hypothetical protein